MSELKNKTTPFTLNGVTYQLSFNMNIVDAAYDEYGSIDAMLDMMRPVEQEEVEVEVEEGAEPIEIKKAPSLREQTRAIDWLVCEMINDAIEAGDYAVSDGREKAVTPFTLKSLRRELLVSDYGAVRDVVVDVVVGAMPEQPAKN